MGTDLNAELGRLLQRVIRGLPDFQGFDSSKIVVSVSRSRSRSKGGVWAYVTPLRYQGGGRTRQGRRRGISGHYAYETKRLSRDYPEALYLVTFLVPRFFFLSPQERLETVVHELYHIHPEFRGDLRRFAPPHIHHGPTPAAFRKKVSQMTFELIALDPGILQEDLLLREEAFFEERKTRHYAVPRRVFIPRPRDPLVPPPAREAMSRPAHPRLLDRFLRLVGMTSLVFALSVHAAPEHKSEDDFENESASGILPQRYLVGVSGLEEPSLRPAPSESAPELFPVKDGELFFWASEDASKEWAFLQTRTKSGWIRKRYVKVVKPLPIPGEREAMEALNGHGNHAADSFSGTLIDGDSAFDPNQRFVSKAGTLEGVDTSHLNGIKAGVDTVTALEPGQFYAEPNPLSERYGLIEAGDQVTFIEKDSTDKWAKIRLDLTGEEGWYPAGWLRVNRIGGFAEPARLGSHNVDVDLGMGSQGNNLGGTVLYSWDPHWTAHSSSRFELGGFLSYWTGESANYGSSHFNVSYLHFGVLPRYVTFTGTGKFAGAFEAGFFYKMPLGTIAGIDSDVVKRNGLDLKLTAALAFVYGLRAYYVLTPKMQIDLGFRGTLSSVSNAYFLNSGVSFKF